MTMKASLLILALSGCVADHRPPPDRLAEIKTIGVISAIGDRLTFETIGASVFGNVEVTEPVEWGIDQDVAGRIAAALPKRYTIAPVSYDAAAFDKIAWADESAPAAGFRDTARRRVEDVLRAAASPQGLDAYIVVTKATSAYAGGHQILRGLGLVRGEGAATHALAAYAIYDLSLIDGSKHVVIGRARASLPRATGFRLVQGAYREVGDALWAPSLAALPAPQQRRLRQTLLELIDQSIPLALAALGLTE